MKRWLTLASGIIIGSLLMISALAIIRPASASSTIHTEKVQAAMTLEGNANNILINYQGRLLDATTGQPKADGSYLMIFSIYNVTSNGTPLWSETKSIPVNKGLFNTLLGDTTLFDTAIFNGQDLYLGITVGSDPETSPRNRIAHTAYAIFANKAENANLAANATNAEQLDNLDSTAFALTNHTHDGDTIDDESITDVDIANGTITSKELATDAVVSTNIRDLQVTTADLANGAVTAQKLASGVLPKFISIDPSGAYLTSSATFSNGFGPNAGIHLADGANGSFYAGFTIPPDFTTGGTLVARLVWHTSATSCSISFPGNAISVARPGRTHIVGGTTATGLTVIGGTKLFAPTVTNQSNETRVAITSPDGVTLLQAGDSIIFSLFRSGSGTDDTCAADMVIQSISVTY